MPFRTLHRLRWPLAPVLGAAATLGYAPFGWWFITLLALALLFAAASRATPWRAALLGWLFGFANFLTGVYWVYISTHVYGGAPAWIGVLLALMLSAYLALYPALVLGIAARLRWFDGPVGWFGVPALWLLCELLRGWVYSGFPWLSLGEIAVDTPVARLLPLIGSHGVGCVVALSAYALHRLGIHHDTRRGLTASAVVFAPMLAVLLPAPSAWTEPDGPAIPVALVQSDIKQDEKWLPAMRYEALLRHWRLTQQGWPASLVVWPEVALTQPYHVLKDGYLADIGFAAAQRGATVILGILVFDGQDRYNSLVAIGQTQGRYDKRHLVPFGEYFPIPDWLRPIMKAINTPYSDFSFGNDEQPLLRVGGHQIESSICFEDVFGAEIALRAREAAYIVNVTNDAWFAGSSAPAQHLVFSRMRAMETGRWMLRAANTGISALINPDGQVVKSAPEFEMTVVRGEAEPRRGLTPYQRWLDLPLWLGSVLLIGAGLLWQWRAARKIGSEMNSGAEPPGPPA